MDKLKFYYYLQKLAAVAVICAFAFAYYQQTHNDLVAAAIAIIGVVVWFLSPKYVPDDGCKVRKVYNTDMHDPETGLTLKATNQTFITFEKMVEVYKATKECVSQKVDLGDNIPPATIEFCSFSARRIPNTWAVYAAANLTVYINVDSDPDRTRSCTTDAQAIEHELIHHFLDAIDLNDVSSTHTHIAFNCGPGVDNIH